MSHFIIGFVVYTLGTIGLLVLGYMGARYCMNTMGCGPKSAIKSYLKVEQGISLEPRKAVYVVKAGNQRFLVATTPENVSCLGELNKDNIWIQEVKTETTCKPQMHPDLEEKLKYINFLKGSIKNPIQ